MLFASTQACKLLVVAKDAVARGPLEVLFTRCMFNLERQLDQVSIDVIYLGCCQAFNVYLLKYILCCAVESFKKKKQINATAVSCRWQSSRASFWRRCWPRAL